MNKIFKSLSFLALVSLFIAACSAKAVEAPPEDPIVPQELIPVTAITYEALLDKPSTDDAVAEFLARNNCSPVDPFQVCSAAGMALLMDGDKKIESVFLYPGNADGFAAYQGQLPYGISFADTMENVEAKLGHPVEIHAPQAGWVPGLPDEGFSPDHTHYHAIYRQLGLTVIYNSPAASDKGATINAIRVNQ